MFHVKQLKKCKMFHVEQLEKCKMFHVKQLKKCKMFHVEHAATRRGRILCAVGRCGASLWGAFCAWATVKGLRRGGRFARAGSLRESRGSCYARPAVLRPRAPAVLSAYASAPLGARPLTPPMHSRLRRGAPRATPHALPPCTRGYRRGPRGW